MFNNLDNTDGFACADHLSHMVYFEKKIGFQELLHIIFFFHRTCIMLQYFCIAHYFLPSASSLSRFRYVSVCYTYLLL